MPGSKAELLETPFGVGAALGFALALGFGLSTGAGGEPSRLPQAVRTRLVIKKLTKDVWLRQRRDDFMKQLLKRDMKLFFSPLRLRFQSFDDS